VPLKLFCDKFSHTRFEPAGWTGNPQLPFAHSVMDYIFRWLHIRFIGPAPAGSLPELFPSPAPDSAVTSAGITPVANAKLAQTSDAPSCRICGSLMRRNGSCHMCTNCGSTSGCS
jgi:ribonucleoside-diphosphate reductase alpha chain